MVKKGVTFVLFGGTGDLTRRKLVPAFADLVHRGVIGKNSTIIGISRKEMSDGDYKKFLVGSEKDMREKGHIKKLKIKYMKGDFSGRGGLTGLKELREEWM
jgi:glucose-6-phosphate 1-dehydrogenase